MPELVEFGRMKMPPPSVFSDLSDSMNGFVFGNQIGALKGTFATMQKRIAELSEENKRLRNSPPSQENIRTEKRFLALIDALKNAPAQQKKFAKRLLDADVALVDAWYKADTEDKRIRALAREEIQSQKP